ncbi:high-potential iron-sulfur protein [Pseudohaliea sp.]|uniref:high-potential iron-sulfur protein n=1 Tax=Pseudohaliea sp. TaxID=2740289 RepID=UPI0032EE4FC3
MRKETPGKVTSTLDRRRALALLGGGAAAVSILGLNGCGGDDNAPRPELIKPEPDGEPMKPPTQAEAESVQASSDDAMADSGQASDMDSSMDSGGDEAKDAASDTIASDGMPKVDEASAKAKQLAYVHDASTVSPGAQPRYAEGQQCANCALYQGGSAEWGACPLFNGQQVKRTGWCNAYAPRGA